MDRSLYNSQFLTGINGLNSANRSFMSTSKDVFDKSRLNGSTVGGLIDASTISNSRESPFMSTHHQILEQELGKTLKVEVPVNNTDIDVIIRKRLENIHVEMDDFMNVLREFA